MQVSEGHLATWLAVARALEQLEPSEVDLLPDMAEASIKTWSSIRNVPGAFDFDLTAVQSVAASLFPVVMAGMVYAAPKLFDASIEVGKDTFKKLFESRVAAKPSAAAAPTRIDAARLHEVVRVAALERRISPANADIIANAVLAQLSIDNSL